MTITFYDICHNVPGVYPSYKEKVLLYIDITAVPELQARSAQNDVCVLGANNTLTNTIEFFYEVAKKFTGFAYLEAVADHISLVANVPVRNVIPIIFYFLCYIVFLEGNYRWKFNDKARSP